MRIPDLSGFGIVKILLLIAMLSSACGSNEEESTIPYVYVNIVINPASIEYGNLNVPGNLATIKGGYRGIVVYHYMQDEYLAFERTCTFDPDKSCSKLKVDISTMLATDTCCGSQFILLDGSALEGSKATRPLKQYHTTFDPAYGQLYIYN
jgi:hypothetical protein